MEELVIHKNALKKEILYLTSKLGDDNAQSIFVTIMVLEQRVKDIEDFIDGIHRRAFEYLEARDNDKHDEAVEAMINKAGSM